MNKIASPNESRSMRVSLGRQSYNRTISELRFHSDRLETVRSERNANVNDYGFSLRLGSDQSFASLAGTNVFWRFRNCCSETCEYSRMVMWRNGKMIQDDINGSRSKSARTTTIHGRKLYCSIVCAEVGSFIVSIFHPSWSSLRGGRETNWVEKDVRF